MQRLFYPATLPAQESLLSVTGLEDRPIFNTPLFVISEIILGTDAIVAFVLLYRRPGRYLARMPTSSAAVIALFAASAAVQDLQGTSSYMAKDRAKYVDDLDHTYGYGSYTSADGKSKVGIEKLPMVKPMTEKNLVYEMMLHQVRKRGPKRNKGKSRCTC